MNDFAICSRYLLQVYMFIYVFICCFFIIITFQKIVIDEPIFIKGLFFGVSNVCLKVNSLK